MDDSQRRAAALQALQQQQSAPTPPVKAFWERNGARIAIVAAVLLALLLGARAVGAYMHNSVSEMDRATEQMRRNLR